jgi:hypothetical protein
MKVPVACKYQTYFLRQLKAKETRISSFMISQGHTSAQ